MTEQDKVQALVARLTPTEGHFAHWETWSVRLRTDELNTFHAILADHARQAEEIERLRAENHQLRSDCEWADSQRQQNFNHALTQEDRARDAEAKLAECEGREKGLREALEEIAEHPGLNACDVAHDKAERARTALSDKAGA